MSTVWISRVWSVRQANRYPEIARSSDRRARDLRERMHVGTYLGTYLPIVKKRASPKLCRRSSYFYLVISDIDGQLQHFDFACATYPAMI